MAIRKDDPAYMVRGRPAPLDKKGMPAGGDIETESDMGFNGQCPPGQYIQDQMLSTDTKRIAALKPHSAAALLKSGTRHQPS